MSGKRGGICEGTCGSGGGGFCWGSYCLLRRWRVSRGADAKSSVEEIRKELMQLPYSGVFDFLAFRYDKGTVTLVGYAYHSNLKHDAAPPPARAARGRPANGKNT